MLNSYNFVAIMVVVALGFPLVALGMAWLIRPKRPTHLKQSTYECGLETIGDTWVQFKVQYYIYALIFVVFDVETVFLFPWAVAYKQLGLYRPGGDVHLHRHPGGWPGLCLAQGCPPLELDSSGPGKLPLLPGPLPCSAR